MSSKKKLIISMLVVAFVLLSIIATIAIAFALTQQTIKTTLNINYSVVDIDGTASASYTIGDVTEKLTAMKGTEVIGEKLVFKAEDEAYAGDLMFPEDALALTSEDDNVVIQYSYSNSGDRHYMASMSFDANIEADNMKVEYSINGTDYSEDRYAVVVKAGEVNRSYWIKISIINKAKNASFTGDFSWNLEGCDETDDSYVLLDSLEFQGSDGAYSVSLAQNKTMQSNIVFPSSVNGDTVTTIAASSLSNSEKAVVTSVTIPETVTTVGESAFNGFVNLEDVIFKEGSASAVSAQAKERLYIEGYSFADCKSLDDLSFPQDKEIHFNGDCIFGSANINTLTLTSNVIGWGYGNLEPFNQTTIGTVIVKSSQDYGLAGIDIENLIVEAHTTYIYGGNIENLTIKSNVNTLSQSSFYQCTVDNLIMEGSLNWSYTGPVNENGEIIEQTIELNLSSTDYSYNASIFMPHCTWPDSDGTLTRLS